MTADSSKQSAEAMMAASKANADRFAEISKLMMEKAMTYPQKVFETQLETSAEMFSFVSRRMQAQAEFLGKLAHCQAPGEALGAQREFATEMSKDYSAEASHLAELTAEMAQANLRNLTDPAPNFEEDSKTTVAA
ncbi:MAG: phasin family protein [Pseudomonadota bacterium]